MKLKYSKLAGVTALAMAMAGCNDYLDITPPSNVAPETYFLTAEQLGTYTLNYYGAGYGGMFSTYDNGGSGYQFYLDNDQGTDNEAGTNDKFFDGTSKVKVGTSGGAWSFGWINDVNYFIETAVPRYNAGEIQGAEEMVRHYIGEAYFLRALAYFDKLKNIGDCPINLHTLPSNKELLIEASKRQPRNLVARQIIADLDTAISMLSNGANTGGRVRITKDVAYLYQARVALYEATFEKYFAGTPFVPDRNAGWPGANKEYLKDFTYDNASEVAFFLDKALAASKVVCDNHPTLTANNKRMIGDKDNFPANPYYDLFCTQDPSSRDEALMYRVYDIDNGQGHCMNQYRSGKGYTQEYANAFLMDNGLPIYADGSGYKGDDFIADTKVGRDWRWRLFMKAPNEYVYADNTAVDQRIGEGKRGKKDASEWKAPLITGNGGSFSSSTGYYKGKGWATNSTWAKGGWDLSATIIFRSAEAYLIYLEAAWEKYGDRLDSNAWNYWGVLRTRAGLPADANVTIAATDLDKEEELTHDFALYSAGQRITSKVLYNIRRERRCEFISEGFRWDDLIRWRALDQLKTKRYYMHGCKLFGPMLDYVFSSNGRPRNLKWDQADPNNNNVSSPNDTEGGFNGDPKYMSLLRVSSKSDWYESGYTWRMAHYLNPIAESHFLESSADGVDVSTSPIYQNPYWGTTHDTPALQ